MTTLLLLSCKEKYDTSGKLEQLRDSISEDSYRYNQNTIENVLNNILAEETNPFAKNISTYDSFYTPISNKLELKPLENYDIADAIEVYRFEEYTLRRRPYNFITIIHKNNYTKLYSHTFTLHRKCKRIINQRMHKHLRDSCINIISNKVLDIDSATWLNFTKLIERTDFWTLRKKDNRLGVDGYCWIIKGSRKENGYGRTYQNYHMVQRWVPKQESSVRQIGEFLMELSGEEISPIY